MKLIERNDYRNALLSPLTEGRGLKRRGRMTAAKLIRVAPHGGAWIETRSCNPARYVQVSPLTEGRGLKRNDNYRHPYNGLSPLTEGRGLKLSYIGILPTSPHVAPHGGAWIETVGICPRWRCMGVAPHGGAWIETFTLLYFTISTKGRPSRRGVD